MAWGGSASAIRVGVPGANGGDVGVGALWAFVWVVVVFERVSVRVGGFADLGGSNSLGGSRGRASLVSRTLRVSVAWRGSASAIRVGVPGANGGDVEVGALWAFVWAVVVFERVSARAPEWVSVWAPERAPAAFVAGIRATSAPVVVVLERASEGVSVRVFEWVLEWVFVLFERASVRVSVRVSERAFERAFVWVLEWASVRVFEWAFERASVRVSEWAFERVSVRVSERALERAFVWVFERASVRVSVSVCLSVCLSVSLVLSVFLVLSVPWLVFGLGAVGEPRLKRLLNGPVSLLSEFATLLSAVSFFNGFATSLIAAARFGESNGAGGRAGCLSGPPAGGGSVGTGFGPLMLATTGGGRPPREEDDDEEEEDDEEEDDDEEEELSSSLGAR